MAARAETAAEYCNPFVESENLATLTSGVAPRMRAHPTAAQIPHMRSVTETRSLRVALLNPCYWPEVRRGSERVVRELADGLIAHGHKPRLITSHPGLPSRTLED